MIARTTNSSIRLNPRLGTDPVYAITCVAVTLNVIPSTSPSRASPPSTLPLHLLVSSLSYEASPLRLLRHLVSSPPSRLWLLLPLLLVSTFGLFSRPLLSTSSLGLFFRPVLSARPFGFTEPCISPGFLRQLRFGIREPTQKIKSKQSASGIVPRQHRSRVLMDDLWWSWIRLPF